MQERGGTGEAARQGRAEARTGRQNNAELGLGHRRRRVLLHLQLSWPGAGIPRNLRGLAPVAAAGAQRTCAACCHIFRTLDTSALDVSMAVGSTDCGAGF
jgi:hypothetical protein